jgi:hypothetical protein
VTQPRFAHASEAELARILDYYGVRWEYETHTFPILWNLEGAVVESFAPDFYLPELDLHVELTTLRQSLVRRKNRKLRRVRELYPDVRIKLFYGKDFRALMLKYGRLDLAASLSGLEGQALAGERQEPSDIVAASQADAADAVRETRSSVAEAAAGTGRRRGRPSRGSRRRRGRRLFSSASGT